MAGMQPSLVHSFHMDWYFSTHYPSDSMAGTYIHVPSACFITQRYAIFSLLHYTALLRPMSFSV